MIEKLPIEERTRRQTDNIINLLVQDIDYYLGDMPDWALSYRLQYQPFDEYTLEELLDRVNNAIDLVLEGKTSYNSDYFEILTHRKEILEKIQPDSEKKYISKFLRGDN